MEFHNSTFSQLLKTLFQNNLYQKAIQQATKKYRIKHYRIQKLKPSGIKNLLKKNTKRQNITSLEENNYAWAQGQLKIFVWILVGYAFVKKIDINDLNQSDFQFFSQIFDGYSPQFLSYQAKFLVKTPQKVAWTEESAKLLNEIIKVKFQQKNWNTVAYQLYIHSDKTVFRTPKQCRQRWLNHQDPVKNHSQWNIQQDLQLLRFVKSIGKKWSLIARTMKSTRTQHMVKNRFASLMKKVSKISKCTSQKQLIEHSMKLKKQEKQDFNKQGIDQEIKVEPVIKQEVQVKVELKQIQHTDEQVYIKKQNQREMQLFVPCNLVPQLDQQMAAQTQENDPQQIVNFFQQDHGYQTQRYQEWFITVPEPTKQI